MPRANTADKFAERLGAHSRVAEVVTALTSRPPVEPSRPDSSNPELALTALRIDFQPRQIVPDEMMERLLAAGPVQPADLLAELRVAATTHPYFADVLRGIEELAENLRVNGVLTPLLVARRDEGWLIQDGHRRSLAAALIGLERVPAHAIDAPSIPETFARQIAVNLQRQDFAAIDKARALLRLARELEPELRQSLGLPDDVTALDSWDETGEDEDEEHPADGRGGSEAQRALRSALRERIGALTGLQERSYQQLMRLNRLTPGAQLAGMALTVGQLRPVAQLPPRDQEPVVVFIARHALGSREADSLVRVVRRGDRDEVQRVMAKLAREDVARERTAVSWQALLNALPPDLGPRARALEAELGALSPEQRAVRLRTMHEQYRRAGAFQQLLGDLLLRFGGFPEDAAEATPAG